MDKLSTSKKPLKLQHFIADVMKDYSGVKISASHFVLVWDRLCVEDSVLRNIILLYSEYLQSEKEKFDIMYDDLMVSLWVNEKRYQSLGNIWKILQDSKWSLRTAEILFSDIKNNRNNPQYWARKEQYDSAFECYQNAQSLSLTGRNIEELISSLKKSITQANEKREKKYTDKAIEQQLYQLKQRFWDVREHTAQEISHKKPSPSSEINISKMAAIVLGVLSIWVGVKEAWSLNHKSKSHELSVRVIWVQNVIDENVFDMLLARTEIILQRCLVDLKQHGNLPTFHQELDTQLRILMTQFPQYVSDVRSMPQSNPKQDPFYLQYWLSLKSGYSLDVIVYHRAIVKSLTGFCTHLVSEKGIDKTVSDLVLQSWESWLTDLRSDSSLRRDIVSALAPMKQYVSQAYWWDMQTQLLSIENNGPIIHVNVPYVAYWAPGEFTLRIKKSFATSHTPR